MSRRNSDIWYDFKWSGVSIPDPTHRSKAIKQLSRDGPTDFLEYCKAHNITLPSKKRRKKYTPVPLTINHKQDQNKETYENLHEQSN